MWDPSLCFPSSLGRHNGVIFYLDSLFDLLCAFGFIWMIFDLNISADFCCCGNKKLYHLHIAHNNEHTCTKTHNFLSYIPRWANNSFFEIL